MKRLLTHTTMIVASVLFLDCRSIGLPLSAAAQGSSNGQPFQALQAEIAQIQQTLEAAPENATVSFGAWQTTPPYDRFPPNTPTDRNRDDHVVVPNDAIIKAGGTVNFVISGFHQPIVYDVGTKPQDIDVNNTTQTTGVTPSPKVDLINDSTDRIYRGQDPSLQPLDRSGTAFLQDRVEVVRFLHPGTYLVICGVKNHFQGSTMPPNPQPPMFGFVTVK